MKAIRWEHAVLLLGVVLLGVAHTWGLVYAPAEAMMGDVGRILYVHVPTAWVALVAYTACFVAAIGALWNGKTGWDAAVEAFAEVGVVYNALLLVQGSVWARPTWGIWWTWDPRLTTTAVMMLLFLGILILRRVIDNPERRLTISAVATIVAWVDVPVVYFAVKWWRTLHQDFSSPETVSNTMVTPLRMAAFGMLFVGIGIAVLRWRNIRARLALEVAAPALPDLPPELKLAPADGEA